jgi:hypothetical protein
MTRRDAVRIAAIAILLAVVGSFRALAQDLTAVVLTASPNAPRVGEAVTLTARVTPETATGNVTFFDGPTPLGSAAVSPSTGDASLTMAMLPAGPHSLRARYWGDASHGSSTSAPLAYMVASVAGKGYRQAFHQPSFGAGPIVGDFNGDGRADFLGRLSGPESVVYLGKGDGTFEALPAFSHPIHRDGVSVDINADGRADLVTTDLLEPSVSVRLGNGDGTFQQRHSIATDGAIGTIVSSDFNRDGIVDFVIERADAAVTLLVGAGDGTFALSRIDLDVAAVAALAVNDFNGDGLQDLAVAGVVGPVLNGVVDVLLGSAAGGFEPARRSDVGPWIPQTMTSADFDRDGNADLAIAGDDKRLRVLTGAGDGSFQPGFSYEPAGNLAWLKSGDFNNDGFVDLTIATSNVPDGGIDLLLGAGDGTFQKKHVLEASGNYLAGEFNGDSQIDFIVFDSSELRVYLSSAPTEPDLVVSLTRGGPFGEGQMGATYIITVTNEGALASGTVTITDTLPAGFIATAMAGNGWSCLLGTLTCTTEVTSLATDVSLPPITLTVNVGGPSPATNGVSVSGGGEQTHTANNIATDTVTILYADLAIWSSRRFAYLIPGLTDEVWTLTVKNFGQWSTTGLVTVTDSIPRGVTTIVARGDGWTCAVNAQIQCSRSDPLDTQATYPPILVWAALSFDAAELGTSVTHAANVSGGGDPYLDNNVHVATIEVRFPDLTLTLAHEPAIFMEGAEGTISITVSGVAGISLGELIVTNTLPDGLSPKSMAGDGWQCDVHMLQCTRPIFLVKGVSLPPIRLTVHVGPGSPSRTNTATLSNKSQVNTSNDTASDVIPVPSRSDVALSISTLTGLSDDTAIFGGTVTLRAQVTPATAQGVVAFHAGARMLGTAAIADGVATFKTNLLPIGSHAMRAYYLGSVLHLPSTSDSQPLSIKARRSSGFSAAGTPSTGPFPGSVTTEDFNHDGVTDLLVVNTNLQVTPELKMLGKASVSVLLGIGNATFKPATSYSLDNVIGGTDWLPVGAATSDFNGDGHPDVVVATGDIVNKDHLAVFFGVGDGQLTNATYRTVNPLKDIPGAPGKDAEYPGLSAIVAADFNLDGRADLAVVDERNGYVYVLHGKGDGTFQPGLPYAVGYGAIAIAIGDFNADGRADLITAAHAGGVVSVLFGRPDGTFTDAVIYASLGIARPAEVAVGDLNGDGILDAIVADVGTAAADYLDSDLHLLMGVGDGGFTPGQIRDLALAVNFKATALPGKVLIDDADGDGDMDAIVGAIGFQRESSVLSQILLSAEASSGGSVKVLPGGGHQSGGYAIRTYPTQARAPYSLTTGDFNGDGRIDIAAATFQQNGTVEILVGAAANDDHVELQDAASCREIGGTWTAISATCTVTAAFTVKAEVALEIKRNVTLAIGSADVAAPLLNNGTLTNVGTIEVIGKGVLTNSGKIRNFGTIRVISGEFWNHGYILNDGLIDNHGKFNNLGDVLTYFAGSTGRIENRAIGKIWTKGLIVAAPEQVANAGFVQVQLSATNCLGVHDGAVGSDFPFVVYGIWDSLGATCTIGRFEQFSQPVIFPARQEVLVPEGITLKSLGRLFVYGTLSIQGALQNRSVSDLDGIRLPDTGYLEVRGKLLNQGQLTNGPGAMLAVTREGQLNNQGTLPVFDDSVLAIAGNLFNFAPIEIDATSAMYVSGQVVNHSVIRIAGTLETRLSFRSRVDQNSGGFISTVDAGTINGAGGIVSGSIGPDRIALSSGSCQAHGGTWREETSTCVMAPGVTMAIGLTSILEIGAGTTLENFGRVVVSGGLDVTGMVVNHASVDVGGSSGDGGLMIHKDGAVLNYLTLGVRADSTLTNDYGTLTNAARGVMQVHGSIVNKGLMSNYGALSMSGAVDNFGTMLDTCSGISTASGAWNGNPITQKPCDNASPAEPTIVTVSTSPNPSVAGQMVSLSAKVTPFGATGTVTFFDGATEIGLSQVDPATSSTPSFGIVTLPAGARAITARYHGNASYAPSTSAPLTHLVLGGVSGPSGVAAADFDRDGQTDLAVASFDAKIVSVLRGQGNGAFEPSASYLPAYDVGASPKAIITGDFTGDGVADIATLNHNNPLQGGVSVFVGNGAGQFEGARTSAAIGAGHALSAGDFNGDAKLDLVVSSDSLNRTAILLGQGTGFFQPSTLISSTVGAEGLAVADFNQDGRQDFAVASASAGQVAVFIGNGNGTFKAPVTHAIAGGAGRAIAVASGDIDHDGRPDLVVATQSGLDHLAVFIGNGDGTFQGERGYTQGVSSADAMELADVNGDGYLDAVAVGGDVASVVLGAGDGRFLNPVTRSIGSQADAMALGDFNGNGALDLATTAQTANTFGVTLDLGAAPDVIVSLDHASEMHFGQKNVPFEITVTNRGDAAATAMVTVALDWPVGSLLPTAMGGEGWTCDSHTGPCRRSDSVWSHGSYPPLVMTADVLLYGPRSFSITAMVSGGGEARADNNAATRHVAPVPPNTLTVVATNMIRKYLQPNPVFTGTVTGIAANHSITATYVVDVDAQALPGRYPITPVLADPDNALALYNVLIVKGVLTVTKGDATISFAAPAGLEVGARHQLSAESDTGITPTLSIVSGPATLEPGNMLLVTGVGTITLKASLPESDRYNAAADVFVEIIGFKRLPLLTVTAQPTSIIYGSGAPSFTASFDGFRDGDTAAALTGTLTFGGGAAAARNVGSYSIVPGGLTSSEYDLMFVAGQLDITPAPLTIAADDISIYAGDPIPELTATYSGFVNGDTPASLEPGVTLVTAADALSEAGLYVIAPVGAANPNYVITFVNGMLRINKAGPPQLSLPGDLTAEATSASGAEVTFPVSASDERDGALPVRCSPSPGSTFPLGATRVTCSAENSRGIGTAGQFTVTVKDSTAPELSEQADVTVPATGPSGAAATFSLTARDIVDGAVAVACSPESGSAFALGMTAVTCSTSDRAGNRASRSFNIIVKHTAPPVFAPLGDLTLEATDAAGARATFNPTASDLVDGIVAVTCEPASGSTFALGTTGVGCTASNSAGFSATASFSVTVQDTTPPSITSPPPIEVAATSADGETITDDALGSPTAFDSVSAVTLSRAPAGNQFPIGTTTITWMAADAAGNSALAMQQVVVHPSVAALIAEVEAQSTLSAQAKRPLVMTLTAAQGAIDRSKARAAKALLGAFVVEVRVLERRGWLAAAAANSMVARAQAIRKRL